MDILDAEAYDYYKLFDKDFSEELKLCEEHVELFQKSCKSVLESEALKNNSEIAEIELDSLVKIVEEEFNKILKIKRLAEGELLNGESGQENEDIKNDAIQNYNLDAITVVLTVINKLLSLAIKDIQKADFDDKTISDLLYVGSLIRHSPELINMALNTEADDILYHPKDSEDWK